MKIAPADGCAWITGASSGIGRGLALRLAAAGWTVVASARSAAELQSMASGNDGIRAAPLDATGEAAVMQTVADIERQVAPIALAVLNAGTHLPVRAASLAVADFRRLIDINLLGTVNCLAAVLPPMLARKRGQIAVVASVAGYRGLPTAAAYGMTKAGLIVMAEALKPELDALGIKLQIVNPGFVRTPLTERNAFAMPFIMDLDDAVEAFYRGLQGPRFEIVFPRTLAYLMKVLRLLPYPLAFAVTRRLLPKS
jgi:NAD(P)-dependent dehydrogenase (short-subunit alcohol dehydrogenase family)